MSKRLSFYRVAGLTSLCIFFLGFSRRYSGYPEHRLHVLSVFTADNDLSIDELIALKIDEVVEQQRRIIEKEMEGYAYQEGKFGKNVSSLNNLIMERNGTPIRSVIVSSWRSGSTFLGDAVNEHPANFYNFEPLMDFGIVQVRGPPLSNEALKYIDSMFKCDYYNLDKYLTYEASHPYLFDRNTRLWSYCQAHKGICSNSQFMSKFCQLFPFQSMKIVRLRLTVAQELLERENLGIRMVLLVRDPRGILQSRRHRSWCPNNPDCTDPALVCADMVSDYKIAAKLREIYPRNFRIVRYEDLSMDPFAHVKDLFDFYGLAYHENVQKFLETHTKKYFGEVMSTFRNSKAAPFHWRTDLDFEEVDQIQNVCNEAMKLWGYVLAINATHQKYFDPTTDYNVEF